MAAESFEGLRERCLANEKLLAELAEEDAEREAEGQARAAG